MAETGMIFFDRLVKFGSFGDLGRFGGFATLAKVRRVYLVVVVVLMLSVGAVADDGDEHEDDTSSDNDGDTVELHAVNAGSKTFHWILTLALEFLMPSISSALAFADRLHWSLILQLVSTAYLVFEVLFLDFPDQANNHENRTSKGTGWFLTLLLGATVFIGTLINGSNFVMNKFYPHLASKGSLSGKSYTVYKTLSLLVVLTGWVRVCMAPVALFGFCYDLHTGQCIAHGIMGSAFVFYGFFLLLVLVVPWIRLHNHPSTNSSGTGRSQEFYDSTVMCVWGIVNTFTEHRWGREGWSHGDYQHTSMGIIWWCGGLLGMWMTRKNNRRSFIPALLLMFTGYAMSQHAQHLQISTKVHAMFGLALISGGLVRIVEISFVLRDAGCSSSGKILSFQYLPSFCLVLSGTLFMSANEEQLILVKNLGADHSSYILVVTSAAFMIYLWFILMISFYLHLVGYDENGELGYKRGAGGNDVEGEYHGVQPHEAEEFELGDLSDDNTPSSTS